MRQVAWYVAIVLATVAGLVLVWEFRQALLLFMLSLATAAAFRPMIDYFNRLRLPLIVSLLLSYLLILGSLVGVLVLISGPLIHEIEQATNRLAISFERLQASWSGSQVAFQQMLAERLPLPEDLFGGMADGQGFAGLVGMTSGMVGLLTNLGLILMLSLYWSADSIHFERLLLSLIPVAKRSTTRLIWRGIDKGIGAYIRSELIQSILAGLLLWLGYRLIGLDYPVLLALIGALAWLIPWFGAVIAVIPALWVGLSSGILTGVLAALYTVVVLVVMEHVIEPRIFWRKNYSPVILVLVILVLAEAYGLIGLILAPLASAGIQIVMKYLLHPDTSYEAPEISPEEDPAALAASLLERLSATRDALQAQDSPPAPEMMSLVQRLESLALKANQLLRGDAAGEKPAVDA